MLVLLRREGFGIGQDFLPRVKLATPGHRCGWKMQEEVGWEPVLPSRGEVGTVAMPA